MGIKRGIKRSLKRGDREAITKPKRGSIRKGRVGGSVLTDRDYSQGFKSPLVKNLVIAVGLSPVLVAGGALWLAGLKLFAMGFLVAFLLISLLSFWAISLSGDQ